MKAEYLQSHSISELAECAFHSIEKIEGIHKQECSQECLNYKPFDSHEHCLNHFIDLNIENDINECVILKDGTIHIGFKKDASSKKYIELEWFGFQEDPIGPPDINGVKYTIYRLERGEYIP